jgi:hypothetical protein
MLEFTEENFSEFARHQGIPAKPADFTEENFSKWTSLRILLKKISVNPAHDHES